MASWECDALQTWSRCNADEGMVWTYEFRDVFAFFCRIFVNYIHVVCMFSSADSISKQSSQNINDIQIWLQILRKLLYLLKSLCPNKPRFIHVFFASGILYLYIQWFRIIETMIARMNLFLRTSAMNCVAKMWNISLGCICKFS